MKAKYLLFNLLLIITLNSCKENKEEPTPEPALYKPYGPTHTNWSFLSNGYSFSSQGYYNNLQDIVFKNDNEWFALSYDHVIKTNDGGVTWTTYHQDSDDQGQLFAIALFEDTLYITEDNKLFKYSVITNQQTLVTLPYEIAFSPVIFSYDSLFYIGKDYIGSAFGILSKNGGNTWQQFNSSQFPYTVHAKYVDPNDNSILVGGAALGMQSLGKVSSSAPFGESWTVIDEEVPYKPFVTGGAFQFYNKNKWYSTYDKFLIKTDDQGQTWDTLTDKIDLLIFNSSNINYENLHHQLFFITEDHALLSLKGKIFESQNGGIDWQIIFNEPEGNVAISKIFKRGNEIFAIGLMNNKYLILKRPL